MPVKWIDNILSHHDVPGVTQRRQGVARRLELEGLVVLGLASSLIHELGISIAPALRIATALVQNNGSFESQRGIAVTVDLSAFRTQVIERLATAVEIAPVPRRGRPPENKTGRLE
jgi:hypothetical protein